MSTETLWTILLCFFACIKWDNETTWVNKGNGTKNLHLWKHDIHVIACKLLQMWRHLELGILHFRQDEQRVEKVSLYWALRRTPTWFISQVAPVSFCVDKGPTFKLNQFCMCILFSGFHELHIYPHQNPHIKLTLEQNMVNKRKLIPFLWRVNCLILC